MWPSQAAESASVLGCTSRKPQVSVSKERMLTLSFLLAFLPVNCFSPKTNSPRFRLVAQDQLGFWNISAVTDIYKL